MLRDVVDAPLLDDEGFPLLGALGLGDTEQLIVRHRPPTSSLGARLARRRIVWTGSTESQGRRGARGGSTQYAATLRCTANAPFASSAGPHRSGNLHGSVNPWSPARAIRSSARDWASAMTSASSTRVHRPSS